jgi:hypothetical protein
VEFRVRVSLQGVAALDLDGRVRRQALGGAGKLQVKVLRQQEKPPAAE